MPRVARRLRTLLVLLLVGSALQAQSAPAASDTARWHREAQDVTITRDDWGIAHVHGTTDADAVFGMIYAQAEDDFGRVEMNYLDALGRRAEADGASAVWQDLRMRLFIDPDSLRAQYARSPDWLRRLMDAWADGLNYYLATHPQVKPRVLTRFEPWMALSFTEGSIGGDIERVSLQDLAAFYGDTAAAMRLGAAPAPAAGARRVSTGGSNGIAIAPQNTRDRHALLLINPHTTFYFRAVVGMRSDEGLHAYGAVTWGQFFIYQGFNERVGWMHTSSGVDVVDEFLERIVHGERGLRYRYGKGLRPVDSSRVEVRYRMPGGALGTRTFTVYRTHHGPIIRAANGRWVSIALMQRPIDALSQSFLRTKARDYRSYTRAMALKANSSNNTIYADADGHIAYLHPQFIPKRDDRFDYTHPVDGSDPATDWHGLLPLSAAPNVLDPPNGWVKNTNDWPYSTAGAYSPKREKYPRYMDVAGENARGLHAIRLLQGQRDFTLESLMHAAYDSYMPAFAHLVPPLITAYDALPRTDSRRARLAAPIDMLRRWDDRWSTASIPTALAVFWGEDLRQLVHVSRDDEGTTVDERLASQSTPRQKLVALATAVDRLTTSFGSWRTPWGDINRFQRLDDSVPPHFSDEAPSIPVGFTSSVWGSLAAFEARPHDGTRRYYGTSGNSFVAVVEFGPRVRARAVTAGGESGHPDSPHFDDEARSYISGNLREVYFYPEQLVGHTERRYHPGT